MGSKGPKVINLSSAPPANYDALDDELDGRRSEEKKTPLRLTLVGSVKEKGFSADPLLRHRISLPQPRVTPFPVARHRSDGPVRLSLEVVILPSTVCLDSSIGLYRIFLSEGTYSWKVYLEHHEREGKGHKFC